MGKRKILKDFFGERSKFTVRNRPSLAESMNDIWTSVTAERRSMDSTFIDDLNAWLSAALARCKGPRASEFCESDLEAMKVFLRKKGTVEYYKTRVEWTRELHEAHDFGTSVRAVFLTNGMPGCEVVLSFGDPAYDVVLPMDGANGDPPTTRDFARGQTES
jgi:hypothetical protein